MEAEIAEKSEKSAENENHGKAGTVVEEGNARAGEALVKEEGVRTEKACVKEESTRQAATLAEEKSVQQVGISAEAEKAERTENAECAESAKSADKAEIAENEGQADSLEKAGRVSKSAGRHSSAEPDSPFKRAKASLQNRDLWLRRLFLMLADMLVITASGLFVLWARFEFHWEMIEPVFLENFGQHLPFLLAAMLIIFWCFRLYHSLWEFAGMQEVIRVPLACVTLMAADYLLIELLWNSAMPRSYFPLTLLCESWGIIGVRFLYRSVRSAHMRRQKKTDAPVVRKNIMVIGAGQAGAMIVREIQNSSFSKGIVCCVIDDDEQKHGSYIHGIRVVGGRDMILRYVERYQIDQIIIAMPSQSKKTVREILDICKETSCDLKVLPGMYQIANDEVSIKDLRDVEINDLLGREPVQIDNESVCRYVTDKVILVTGGGGSIGSALCRQISDRHPKQLIILDIYENNAYDIQQELLARHPNMNLTVLIGSVRNTNRVEDILSTYRPEIIYHAAAHKHVPLMEDSPNEAIKNNAMGTMKLAQAADKWGVKKFVLISTDKAVNPTNIMGASKRLCEMIIQAYNRHSATDFVAVRFGNVLGSNGSVIPLFKKQIAA
ncbi:MAG: polysaccharide biosynthesis protein, partial [Lachnospiraceae bacterium]|nr:polysaccharide biosynthesis protein [Lachnospiraceae bacterium]